MVQQKPDGQDASTSQLTPEPNCSDINRLNLFVSSLIDSISLLVIFPLFGFIFGAQGGLTILQSRGPWDIGAQFQKFEYKVPEPGFHGLQADVLQ